ncbi:MAG: hypothetical protein PF481_01885 [Bacteroidales bacterium]|nr:hypothetical protein [Bacteroidales bacterium]
MKKLITWHENNARPHNQVDGRWDCSPAGAPLAPPYVPAGIRRFNEHGC